MFRNSVIAVIGSRTFTDEVQVSAVLEHYIQPGQTILTNAANGASLLTRVWCRKHGVPFQVISAERDNGQIMWDVNNAEIAEKCDAMILFWDGGSVGAIDAAWKADLVGKQVLIVQVEPVSQATSAELTGWKDRLRQRFMRAG